MNSDTKTAATTAPLCVTAEQAWLLFQTISTTAGTARSLAMGASAEIGSRTAIPAADVLNALCTMLEQIGALADVALGEDVVGSVAHWACGPHYGDSGQVAAPAQG